MNEQASELVVDLAKSFIEYIQSANLDAWDEAFLRFHSSPGQTGVTSIYRAGDEGEYFRSPHKFDFYKAVDRKFRALRDELARAAPRQFCVCLLRVDSEYHYKMLYEYDDPTKWEISKEDGGSGIPKI